MTFQVNPEAESSKIEVKEQKRSISASLFLFSVSNYDEAAEKIKFWFTSSIIDVIGTLKG